MPREKQKLQQEFKFRLKHQNLLHVLVVYLCFKFGVVGVWGSRSPSYTSTVASTQAWRRNEWTSFVAEDKENYLYCWWKRNKLNTWWSIDQRLSISKLSSVHNWGLAKITTITSAVVLQSSNSFTSLSSSERATSLPVTKISFLTLTTRWILLLLLTTQLQVTSMSFTAALPCAHSLIVGSCKSVENYQCWPNHLGAGNWKYSHVFG